MKISVICIGKLSLNFLRAGAEEYSTRIKRYSALKIIELKEEKGGSDSAFIRERESQRLLERIPATAHCVVLDEKGKQQGSVEFASALERRMLHGDSEWCFVIGGAYGVNETLRRRADMVLSLSRMTWTHQMARILLLEQLYRAFTIMRGEPYHNR
ncbi:MAG: 23S rRNA (pseudouridine(1915)-N(3))-methyltransferase RlmH [Thermodesulfobacteriota bacterium]